MINRLKYKILIYIYCIYYTYLYIDIVYFKITLICKLNLRNVIEVLYRNMSYALSYKLCYMYFVMYYEVNAALLEVNCNNLIYHIDFNYYLFIDKKIIILFLSIFYFFI